LGGQLELKWVLSKFLFPFFLANGMAAWDSLKNKVGSVPLVSSGSSFSYSWTGLSAGFAQAKQTKHLFHLSITSPLLQSVEFGKLLWHAP
jgi:hypothetical protein